MPGIIGFSWVCYGIGVVMYVLFKQSRQANEYMDASLYYEEAAIDQAEPVMRKVTWDDIMGAQAKMMVSNDQFIPQEQSRPRFRDWRW